MNVTFGFLTRTDSYKATIPDTMTDGAEQGGSVTLDEVVRSIGFSPDKGLASANGQVQIGTVAGVPVYEQVGTSTLDPLGLPNPDPLDLVPRPYPLAGSVHADFTMSPNPAVVGQPVTFNASTSATGGFGCQYPQVSSEWDLDGDGVFGDVFDTNGAKAYDDAGAVPVTLRATSDCGPIAVVSHLLIIEPDPTAVSADADIPEIRFLYWTLTPGVVFTHACVSDEGAAALQTLATNISPYLDAKSLPRVQLSGPLSAGDLADESQRPQTIYYGLGSPFSVVFTFAGSYAADSEIADQDEAIVTRTTSYGVTVSVDGAATDIDALRSQAATIAASVAPA